MTTHLILVTGGAGFVGSHLVERLLAEGHTVHVLDSVPLEEAMNLAAIRHHPRLHYVEGDLRSPGDIRRFWKPEAACLYHLASVVGITHYLSDPVRLIDSIVLGTRNLLEEARRTHTRVIFSSTSEVYGKNPAVPWSESGDRVLGPTSVDRWNYSSSKAICEHMLYAFHQQDGLPFSIVRFFNTYGPRQNPCFVVSQSVHRALNGRPPLLYDQGTMTRCFTYIDDLIDVLSRMADIPEAVGEAFNLGSATEVSIRGVIDLILSETGLSGESLPVDTETIYGCRYEDIIRRVPATDKARDLLGWEATTPVEEGIARTVLWARENPWWLARPAG